MERRLKVILQGSHTKILHKLLIDRRSFTDQCYTPKHTISSSISSRWPKKVFCFVVYVAMSRRTDEVVRFERRCSQTIKGNPYPMCKRDLTLSVFSLLTVWPCLDTAASLFEKDYLHYSVKLIILSYKIVCDGLLGEGDSRLRLYTLLILAIIY